MTYLRKLGLNMVTLMVDITNQFWETIYSTLNIDIIISLLHRLQLIYILTHIW